MARALTEYNEAEAMELFREEGREEGTLETLVALVRKGLLTVRQAAEQAQLSDAEFKVRAGLANAEKASEECEEAT